MADFLLKEDEKGLYLKFISNDNFKPIRVDFESREINFRIRSQQKELIAKAVGIKSNYKPCVLDATAGLGKDAFILATLGCEVVCVEKSPIVFALLQDGLNRAAKNPKLKNIVAKIKLINADSEEFLKNSKTKFDVIYLDPMFPERKKSAKVKKEMQILERILPKEDAAKLFEMALKKAKNRVVVKRPKGAPSINNRPPNLAFHGKTIRFDVYIN